MGIYSREMKEEGGPWVEGKKKMGKPLRRRIDLVPPFIPPLVDDGGHLRF